MTTDDTRIQLRNDFEEIKQGYVGIQVSESDSEALTRSIQTTTVGSMLNSLNHAKAVFLRSLVEDLKELGFNLDLVILASSVESEAMIVEALSEYDWIDFILLKDLYRLKTPPAFGVLMSLRQNHVRTHFRQRADFILFFDRCMMENKESYVSLFRGYHHKKPQVVSLVCLRTIDVPVSNYRDTHPGSSINMDMMLKDLPPNEAYLFYELGYPKMNSMNRHYYNELVSERLADWMELKDGSEYKPDLAAFKILPIITTQLNQPSVIHPDYSTKSEDLLLQSMVAFGDALDRAHAKLSQLIYGN